MARSSASAFVLLVVLSSGVAARTPQAQSPAIPADVVSLLMRIGAVGDSTGTIQAGPPPADFPLAVLPAGAQPIATAISAANGTTVIATAPDVDAGRLRAHYLSLVSAGWTEVGPRVRGFVTTTVPQQFNVCRGADFVVLAAYPRQEGGSYLRATVVRDTRRACFTPPIVSMADVDVPMLTAPDGVRLFGPSSSGGLDSQMSTVRAASPAPVRTLADHFESQLIAAGWKIVGRARVRDAMSLTTFALTSHSGDALTGWLGVTALGDNGDADVVLRIVRNARDPRMNVPGRSTTLRPILR
jgi:hypothetical protein